MFLRREFTFNSIAFSPLQFPVLSACGHFGNTSGSSLLPMAQIKKATSDFQNAFSLAQKALLSFKQISYAIVSLF